MLVLAWIVIFLGLSGWCLFDRYSLKVFAGMMLGLLLALTFLHQANVVFLSIYWVVYVVGILPMLVPQIRQRFYSRPIMSIFKRVMPAMSDTERQALEAGTVGWTGELFSGTPDWQKLHAMPGSALSEEEQAFLDGPVETLCGMVDDWKISRSMTIPDEIWNYVRQNGFFSMIIPKSYGGLGFSAIAHSEVISKLSSVSAAIATAVSVPNSLGPAELLHRYGTKAQQDHYLPRLAKGIDIPCFALTSPVAGSDAGSIQDYGVVCQAEFDGKEQLCIRLNWNKRYITLAPIATLLGLAFKLYDPEHLLGSTVELGITCALIPVSTPGVVTGRRHYPLDCAFPNGPTQGKDVVVPVDWIIGGAKMAGQGWRMLMECLATGRSISLPSMINGASRRSVLCTGAYSRIRRQFNTAVGNFEGIQGPLASMLANAYMMDSLRCFTVNSVDQGQEPVVESAIVKYHATNKAREVAIGGMDIQGGKAICMGPSNYMAQGYIEVPISITVEGANILTRSMIIFGQGAIRCHPYVLTEIQAASNHDRQRGLEIFDKAIFGHIGFALSNVVRSFTLGLSSAYLAKGHSGEFKRYYQQLTRFSSVLGMLADMSMFSLGGQLKRLEFLSARLGDVLSGLYTASAVLQQHQLADSTVRQAEKPIIHWICQSVLYDVQTTINTFLDNFPVRWLACLMRGFIFPLGRRLKAPGDRLTADIAKLTMAPGPVRDRLYRNLYQGEGAHNHARHLGEVLVQAISVEPLLKKISKARKAGQIHGMTFDEYVSAAVESGICTAEEAAQLRRVNNAKMTVINVDDFSSEEITHATQ